jgi:hypothetical protein
MAATRKSPARKKTGRAKPKPRAKTKSLAITGHVRREAPSGPALMDRQLDLFRVMMAWSPISVMLTQQAAFWERVASSAGPKTESPKKGSRRRRAV